MLVQAPTFDLRRFVGIKALQFKHRVTIEQMEHISIQTEIKLGINKGSYISTQKQQLADH